MPAASQTTVDWLRQRIRDVTSSGPGVAVPNTQTASSEGVSYIDPVYENSVQFALDKLSYDFAETYSVDSDVPAARRFLMLKLATIELAFLRAGDASGVGTGVDDGDGDIKSIRVPDLTVEESEDATGTDFWLALCDKLQSEYDGELERGEGGGSAASATAQVHTAFRTSLRTGTRINYNRDSAPTPTTLTATVSGSDVILSWAAVNIDHFNQYEIFRAATAAELASPDLAQRIKLIHDIHGHYQGGIIAPRITDTAPGAGTWYYMIAVANRNDLRGFSPVVSAVVP